MTAGRLSDQSKVSGHPDDGQATREALLGSASKRSIHVSCKRLDSHDIHPLFVGVALSHHGDVWITNEGMHLFAPLN